MNRMLKFRQSCGAVPSGRRSRCSQSRASTTILLLKGRLSGAFNLGELRIELMLLGTPLTAALAHLTQEEFNGFLMLPPILMVCNRRL
mmetsp:Transcript_50519/g.116604  ORF Transcript_50519/g.116604 Transcript_50519/m.116604 type:complete len:88 (-) Transcript_50519:29-292(-)